jgi:nitrogen fixation protein NifU and related proteins
MANQVFRTADVRRYNSRMEMELELKERLSKIYSETTIDHIVHPQNNDSLPNPDGFGVCCSDCGESMKIWLRIRNDIVGDAGFWTDGCAATIACGSMATDLVKGKTVPEALAVSARRIADALVDLPEGNFHCSELAAHTLQIALKDCLAIRQDPWKKLYRK